MLLRIVSLLVFLSMCYASDSPIVQTSLGTIRGSLQATSHGQEFFAFEGIPYAKPPIGDLRFESPVPVEPWKGIWDAQFLVECAQTAMMEPKRVTGQEDCLYLNVYVPSSVKPDSNLDVIVHIHGGSFMHLSGHFYSKPDLIMNRDVVFVTFNYRLGVLGFLSTEDEIVPGNNGLKDQTLALRWIHENIASFGGNPNSVTLTGLSAGGASVHLHYFSESSRNLFHRGFSQSGVAFNPWVIQEAAAQKAKILGAALECPTSDSGLMVKCLKQRPYWQILEQVHLFLEEGILPIAPFAPVVESNPNGFITEHPYLSLKNGKVLDVPWVLSNTAHEGYIPNLFEGKSTFFEENWAQIAPVFLDFNYTLDAASWADVSQKIREFYFGDTEISSDNIDLMTQLFGDRLFAVDSEEAVKLQAKASNLPVYFYVFAYHGDNAETKYVSHGSDSRYFFGPHLIPLPLSESDEKVSELLLDLLVSYAKTGVPEIKGMDWPPSGSKELTYLTLKSFDNDENSVRTVEELTPVEFWKSLGLKENANLVDIRDEL